MSRAFRNRFFIIGFRPGTAVRLLGRSEAAARFPSAVAALLLVLLIHGFLLRWLPSRLRPADSAGLAASRGAALLGALSLATVPALLLWARAATTDMTLTLFITAAVLALAQADLTVAASAGSCRSTRRWYLLSAIAAALAFLTKGPVGVIIPALVWLCYHLVQRDLPAEVRRVPWAGVLGLFFLLAVPWYLATYLLNGPAFITHFFVTENLERYTTRMEGHGAGSIWLGLIIYWPIALVMLFPYSPWLVHECCAPFAGNRALRADALLGRLRCFAWCWLGATIVLFSLSRTQLPSYIQSISGAAGILFALHVLGRLTADGTNAGKEAAPKVAPAAFAGEVALLLLVGAAAVYFLGKGLLSSGFTLVRWLPPAPIPQRQALLLVLLLGIIGGLFLAGTLVFGALRHSGALLSWVMVTWTLLLLLLALGIGPLGVRSNYQQMAQAGAFLQRLPDEMPVISFFGSAPEILVYYAQRQQPIQFCTDDAPAFLGTLAVQMTKCQRACVVTDSDGLAAVKTKYAVQPLQQFGPHIFILAVSNPQDGTRVHSMSVQRPH